MINSKLSTNKILHKYYIYYININVWLIVSLGDSLRGVLALGIEAEMIFAVDLLVKH